MTRNSRNLLILLLMALLAAPAAVAQEAEADEATASEAKLEKARLAYIPLSGSPSEGESMGGLFAELSPSLASVIRRIEKAGDDDEIHGLVLDMKGLGVGYGQIHELHGAIERYRESGKKVHAYMEVGATRDYLVAAACDDITMPESGYLMVPGVRTEATFYKGMFDLLGIEADFLHMGEAKGAAEPYNLVEVSASRYGKT